MFFSGRTKFRGEAQIAKYLDKLFNDRVSLGMLIVTNLCEILRIERLDYNKDESSTSSVNSKCIFGINAMKNELLFLRIYLQTL